MKRLTLVVSVALVSACGKTPDSALSVKVHVAPALKADCVELAVFAGGSQKKSLLLERTAMKEDWVVGVRRGDDLPETVAFQARAYLGTCTDSATLKLNARSGEAQATFPKEGVANVQLLQLDPPDATLDGDRDGYVSVAQGGADCDDLVATTFPGSVQLCSTEADTDCDGVAACADSDCAASAECVDPPDRLSLTNVPLSLPRTQCGGPVTVSLRNALGPRAAGLTTAVQLASSLSGVTFFTDPGCTVATTSVTIPFQQDSTTVYLRGDVAGTAVLTASSGSLTPASSDVVIAPLQATQLVFTSPPRTLPAGGCAMNEMTVELRDAMDRPTTVTSDLTVSLSASPQDLEGNFSVTADCAPASATTSATIPAGAGSVTFRVFSRKATPPGAPMHVTAQVDVGLPSPLVAAQDVTVTPAAPAKLAFANSELAIPSGGVCSQALSDVRLQVVVQDQFGNPTPAALATSLSITGPTGVTFHDATTGDCAVAVASLPLAAGATQVDFYLKGTAPVSGMVTVSDATGTLAAASQRLTVTAGTPTRVAWDMNPRTALSNQCTGSPLTLGAYDASGAPASFAAPLQIALSALPAVAGLSFYTSPGCPTGSRVTGNVTFPAGATQLQLYFQGPTAAPAFTVRATPTSGGITGSDLAGNSILPGPPASLRFSPTSQSVQAGVCAGPFTVGIFDAANNATAFGAATDLSFTAASGAFTWGTSATSCAGTTPLPLGTQTSAQVWFTSTAARAYTLSGTTTAMVSTSNTVALTVTPGASTGLTLVEPASATQTLTAGNCLRVNVARKDQYGNDVPVGSATTLTFNPVPTGVTFHADLAGCQAKTGAVASFALGASESSKAFYVRAEKTLSAATLTASLLGQTTSLTLTVNPATTASIAFVGLPTSKQSGVCSGAISLVRRDAYGNDATGDPLLAATVSGAGVTYFASADCSGPGGTSVAADFAATSATSATISMKSPTVGTYPVLASGGGFSDTKNFSVTVGAASKVVLNSPGGAQTAGDCVTLTAEVRDANDNPVAGNYTIGLAAAPPTGVTFFSMGACGGTSGISSKATGGSASTTFSFRVTAPAASLVVTASSGGLTSATATYSVSVGSATKLVIPETPAPATAGECLNASAQVQDAYNNPVPGTRAIDLSASPATGVTFYDGMGCAGSPLTQVSTAGGSSASFSFKVTKTAAAQGITVASTGLAPATKSWAVSAGAAAKLVITTAGSSVNAGACLDVTAEVRDANDNLVTGTRNVDFAAAPATGVTFYSGAACGSGAGATTKSTSGGSSVSFSFRANTPTPMLVVTVSSTGLTSGTQTWVINLGPPAKVAWKTAPPTTLARFTCSNAATVQLVDQADNVTNATADTTVTLNSSAAGAGLSFFSDSACTTTAASVVVTNGTSEASFYVAVTGSSMTNVTGTSNPLTATPTAPVTPSGSVTDVLVVTPATAEVEPGACVAVTVARQTSGGAPITMGVSTFTVTSNNSAAVSFSSASDCSSPASSIGGSIANGASTATVYVRGKSVSAVTSVTLTATDGNGGLTAGTAMVNAYPLVRRGTCDLADTSLTTRCVLSPAIPGNDIGRSFLVFNASGDTRYNSSGWKVNPTDSNVECHLDATASDTAVVCSRGDNHQAVAVNYQVVSWGRGFANGGVTVRHLTGTFADSATSADVTISPSLTSLSSSFLLFSSSSVGGTLNGEAQFPTARILDASTVRLARATAAAPALNYSIDVVEFAGAAVERGSSTNQSGTSFTVSGLTNQPQSRSFILYSARTDAATADDEYVCKRRLKARHNNNTSLTFTRGAGGGGATTHCSDSNVAELAWQRVTLPACSSGCTTAQHPADVTLNDTVGSNTATITAVETHRSVVFFAGQGAGGQAAGEGNLNLGGADGDNTAALHGRASFTSATQVQVDRALSQDKAVFAPQVVQFDP